MTSVQSQSQSQSNARRMIAQDFPAASTALRVTRVEIYPASRADGSPYRASAAIVLNGGYKVYGLTILRRKAGLAIEFPQYERRDGSRVDSSHPLDQATRAEVVGAVLEACRLMGMA